MNDGLCIKTCFDQSFCFSPLDDCEVKVAWPSTIGSGNWRYCIIYSMRLLRLAWIGRGGGRENHVTDTGGIRTANIVIPTGNQSLSCFLNKYLYSFPFRFLVVFCCVEYLYIVFHPNGGW